MSDQGAQTLFRRQVTKLLADMDYSFQATVDEKGQALWHLSFTSESGEVPITIVALTGGGLNLYHVAPLPPNWATKAHGLLALNTASFAMVGIDSGKLVVNSTLHESWLNDAALRYALGAVIHQTVEARRVLGATPSAA